jgi:hypothetical protein
MGYYAVDEVLVRVTAPHFVGGLVLVDDHCVACAPILRRACLGKSAEALRLIFETKGWRATRYPMPSLQQSGDRRDYTELFR